jgi:hypothetical protein
VLSITACRTLALVDRLRLTAVARVYELNVSCCGNLTLHFREGFQVFRWMLTFRAQGRRCEPVNSKLD